MAAYWLVKSEPDAFGIDDLRACKGKRDSWDGVRNYQARNYMREMSRGDLIFFYHSNCPEPGIAGIAEVAREVYPDHTAFDPDTKYFDPKSDPANPRWFMVDVRFRRKLKRVITLAELKALDELAGFPLVRKGNRLSVMPVSPDHWEFVLGLE